MRLLIVGSLNGQIGAASKIAIARGARVAHADDIAAALQALRSGQGADLVMIDDKLEISSLISSLESERIIIPVVACGLGNDPKTAVAAIKAGAQEYIPLPPDAELIAAVLEAVTEENSAIVYEDPAMASIIRLADQIAPSDATVLITGESGTGKELMARYIHSKSRRGKKKFVSVNCAAIPEHLLESELFGHEKGAFTGAVARRIGKFEEATGGTLLLDEISEMDLRLQAKMLRAIQEREIDRVGGSDAIKIDIRLIATSNRNLEDAVQEGRFREDLFFRLNVFNLKMPPLRERPRDLEKLSHYFVEKYSETNGLPLRRLSQDAQAKLNHHVWRGNVRELENTIHRGVLLSSGDQIEAEEIILSFDGKGIEVGSTGVAHGSGHENAAVEKSSGPLVGKTVAEVERDLIIETLHHCFGNRTHAANILGISIRTLRNKLKQYSQEGVAVPMPGEPDRATL